MATRNKQAFVTFGALADIIAPLSQGGVWITGNDFGTNPKATLEKLFPGTTWQDSKTTVNIYSSVEKNGDLRLYSSNQQENNTLKLGNSSSTVSGGVWMEVGGSSQYASGLKLSGGSVMYKYKRTA